MELNRNSISARVYRNFYETSNMPESLCPYFWKLVAAWPLTILFFPLLLPFWIGENFNKDKSNRMPFPAQALIGLILYLLLYFLFCIGVTISAFWITYSEKSDWYARYLLGWVVIGVIAICLITYGIIEWRNHLRIKKMESRYDENGNYLPNEEPKPSIIVEFVKAKYNKYCPKIDWKN